MAMILLAQLEVYFSVVSLEKKSMKKCKKPSRRSNDDTEEMRSQRALHDFLKGQEI